MTHSVEKIGCCGMVPVKGLGALAGATIAVLAGTIHLSAVGAASPAEIGAAALVQPALVSTCTACHGAAGEGNQAIGTPRLAGLGAAYLKAQLDAFADGARKNAVMQPIAYGLDAASRLSLSVHFAGLPAPAALADISSVANISDRGAWIAVRGHWSAEIPGCVQCHGLEASRASERIPPLVGQSGNYIAAQLEAWKHGDRPGGPLDLMSTIAMRLSPEDLAAVTGFYGRLASSGNTTAGVAVPASAPRTSPELPATEERVSFTPAAEASIPDDDFGREVRRGEDIFLHTSVAAKEYVGSPLNCVSCHLDAGRRADSAPLWGAYTIYPAYRKKTRAVNTFAERIQGCFAYSENGKAPALGDPILTALETYAYWMAKGAPVGVRLPGTGYPKLARPPLPPDFLRGANLFATKCALCHGSDGQGQGTARITVFPALWGDRSFNWGAGMEQLDNAAGFIKANMPLGLGRSLSDQEAWDLAQFVDSHERPQDPRFVESTAKTREAFHQGDLSMYGLTVDGHVLGSR